MSKDKNQQLWRNLDALYERLEKGIATSEERKMLEGISQVIIDQTRQCRAADLQRRRLHRRMVCIGMGMAACVLVAVGFFWAGKAGHHGSIANTAASTAGAAHLLGCTTDSLLHLPDGTSVYLAAGSTLAIDAHFGQADRVVALSGEAFFEVAKDASRAFIVRTGSVSTTVHGTSFNVMAYDKARQSQVAVRTGCVEVREGSRSFGRFNPGDRLVYDNPTGTARRDRVTPDLVGAWREGGFCLDRATVDELSRRIHARFHLRLVVQGEAIPADACISYRSYADTSPGVEQVMRSICAVYGARFSISGNEVRVTR